MCILYLLRDCVFVSISTRTPVYAFMFAVYFSLYFSVLRLLLQLKMYIQKKNQRAWRLRPYGQRFINKFIFIFIIKRTRKLSNSVSPPNRRRQRTYEYRRTCRAILVCRHMEPFRRENCRRRRRWRRSDRAHCEAASQCRKNAAPPGIRRPSSDARPLRQRTGRTTETQRDKVDWLLTVINCAPSCQGRTQGSGKGD